MVLTEARQECGGRVLLESQLPNLIEWRRVMDWRLTQLEKLDNVSVYPGSKMTAEDVIESGIKHVVIATGATWRRDGIGPSHWNPIPGHDKAHVYTPEDIMTGKLPTGHVLIFDDDYFYMGGVLAERLIESGCTVTLITPVSQVSAYTKNTLEQEKIQARLIELGVKLQTHATLESIHKKHAKVHNALSDKTKKIKCNAVVLIADRLPNDELYQTLKSKLASGEIDSLRPIGDCDAPHIIERAVFAGHLAAREFDEEQKEGTPFLIERFQY